MSVNLVSKKAKSGSSLLSGYRSNVLFWFWLRCDHNWCLALGSVSDPAIHHTPQHIITSKQSHSIHRMINMHALLQVLVRLLNSLEIDLLGDETHPSTVLHNTDSLLLAAILAVFEKVGSSHYLHVFHCLLLFLLKKSLFK